jgi:hypothetical protein
MREVEDMKRHPENHKGYNDVQAMFDYILNKEDWCLWQAFTEAYWKPGAAPSLDQ